MNTTTTQDPFEPTSSYTPPKSEGNYLKFGTGTTEFLPLSSPVVGWQYWNADNKPVRLAVEPTGSLAELPGIRAEEDGKFKVSHFWAFPVIDCTDGRVKILEITQKTVQNDIRAYIKNPRWGSPVMKYTFTVQKQGEKFDTKYTVMANPLAATPVEWVAAWSDVKEFGFNLNELFLGGDPFKPSASTVQPVAAAPVAATQETVAPAATQSVDAATPPN